MGLLKKTVRYLGLIILAWLLYAKVDIKTIINVFFQTNITYLFLAVVVMFVTLFLKYTRILLNLKSLGVNIPSVKLFTIYINSLLVGQMTTQIISTIGAAIATVVSSKSKKKIGIGNVYVMNNIIDLLFAIFIMSYCLLLNKFALRSIELNLKPNYFFTLIFVVATLSITLFLFRNKIYLQKVQNIFKEIIESFRVSYKYATAISIFIWSIYILGCYIDAKVLNINASLSFLLLVFTSGSIITAIPISFAGIGTRDLVFIYLFSLIGIPAGKAFALSFFSFIINPLLVIGFLYLITLSLRNNNEISNNH